jgi:hypothetical protein
MIPKKMDYWLAKNMPDLYTLLWTWHLVRNDPPYWSYDRSPELKKKILSQREWTIVGYGAAAGLFLLIFIIIALQQ